MRGMGVSALLLSLLVSLAYVDARCPFVRSDAIGKSIEVPLYSSHQGQRLVASSILSPDKLSPAFLCDSCLEISRKVEKVLTNPQLPMEIGDLYNQACHLLPSDLAEKCVETLEMYANQAIEFLQIFFAEEKLCNSTGICPGGSSTLRISTFDQDEKSSVLESSKDRIIEGGKISWLELQLPSSMLQKFISKVSNNKSCEACHMTMDSINNQLEDPEMKMKMITDLLKVCDKVHEHMPHCKQMVVEYGPIILTNLEKFMKNNDVCLMLHICEAPESDAVVATENPLLYLELPTTQLTQALKSSK